MLFLNQDTKGRKPKFLSLQRSRTVQKLGKVWLDPTFVVRTREDSQMALRIRTVLSKLSLGEMVTKQPISRRGKTKRIHSPLAKEFYKMVA